MGLMVVVGMGSLWDGFTVVDVAMVWVKFRVCGHLGGLDQIWWHLGG